MAIALTVAGAEVADLHIFDLATGERVDQVVPRVNGEVVVRGWTEATGDAVLDRLAELRDLVGGFLVSAGLLLASVLIDRRRAMKNDKYTKVQK